MLKYYINDRKETIEIGISQILNEIGIYLFDFIEIDFTLFNNRFLKEENKRLVINDLVDTFFSVSNEFSNFMFIELQNLFRDSIFKGRESEENLFSETIANFINKQDNLIILLDNFKNIEYSEENINLFESFLRSCNVLSKLLKRVIIFCLDIKSVDEKILNDLELTEQEFNNFDCKKKWYVFNRLERKLPNEKNLVKVQVEKILKSFLSQPERLIFATTKELIRGNEVIKETDIRLLRSKLKSDIQELKKENMNILEVYDVESIFHILYISLTYLIFKELKVKRCLNCGKYFVFKNINAEYCDRVIKNNKLTCKDIGPTKKFKEKIEQDEVMKIFKRVKTRNYMRSKRNPEKYPHDEFLKWCENAEELLRYVNKNKISLLEFEERLTL